VEDRAAIGRQEQPESIDIRVRQREAIARSEALVGQSTARIAQLEAERSTVSAAISRT
jgi:hypothetical protein